MSANKQLLLYPYTQAPFTFGRHPAFKRSFREHRKLVRRCVKEGRFDISLAGFKIPLSSLADPRHPDVFIIPRNGYFCAIDEWNDEIGFEKTDLPFSSTDFYIDLDEPGLFYDLSHTAAFSRLLGINQLGFLVPPRPEEWGEKAEIAYLIPQFHHNRLMHSLLAALLMEVVLARNGFSQARRIPPVLTAAYHDIAIPAGGDSIKRVDPKRLDEEENFSWLLEYHGLAALWTEQFGFDLALAQEWVKGQGTFGHLLDVIDKICYTALDCYWIGLIRSGRIRTLCLEHPLIIDVWQDIQLAPDQITFAFSDPERLFLFLLLRAYEHQEFLLNPYSRTLDLFLKQLVKPLYKQEFITREQLLIWDDELLYNVLRRYYPRIMKGYIEPEELSWKRFQIAEERKSFQAQLGHRIDHTDYTAEFLTGLEWPVFYGGEIVPLRRALSQEKVGLLEGIARSTRGYYVYYRT